MMTGFRWSVLGAAAVCGTAWLAGPAPAQQYGAPYGQAHTGNRASYGQAIEKAQEMVAEVMDAGGIPGLSIAVGVNGEIVWSQGFGFASVELGVPVTTLTKFRSGSTSKPITQAAASRLKEEGRFDFDVSVRQYVPQWPHNDITPRMLMAHTSGIRHYDPNSTEFYSTKHYSDFFEALEIFVDDPLLFEPGTEYSYTTYGANLLGMAVQSAAGEDFYSVLKRYVFEPLGMRSTVGDHTDSIIPMRTAFYERTGAEPSYRIRQSSWGDGTTRGVLLNGPYSDNSNKRAGGGLLTTPEDLVRFGSAHLEPGFLRKESLDEILTSARFNDGRETGRGLNWVIGVDDAGRRYIGHGGGGVGGTSDLIVYLDSGVVVAVQCNLTDAEYDDLATRVALLFIGETQ